MKQVWMKHSRKAKEEITNNGAGCALSVARLVGAIFGSLNLRQKSALKALTLLAPASQPILGSSRF
jgi:hypothetical protein